MQIKIRKRGNKKMSYVLAMLGGIVVGWIGCHMANGKDYE